MKLTLKHKNFVLIFEPSDRLVLICIGLIFGLNNVIPYVWMESFPCFFIQVFFLIFINRLPSTLAASLFLNYSSANSCFSIAYFFAEYRCLYIPALTVLDLFPLHLAFKHSSYPRLCQMLITVYFSYFLGSGLNIFRLIWNCK